MKKQYLDEIRKRLSVYVITESEITDIINDYSQMYDDGRQRGLTDHEVIEFLGSAEKVVDGLAENYTMRTDKQERNHKLVALSPFLAVIAFFILGFGFDLWHPGWLVFLIIPVFAIISNSNFKNSVVALSPFAAVIAFLVLGFGYDLWHPGWLVFLIIPVLAILMNQSHQPILGTITALSPFAAVVAFIFLGTYANLWNPGWLVFLIIPMIGILHERHFWKAFGFEVSMIVAIGIYLYFGYVLDAWNLGAIGFLIPIAYGFMTNMIKITWGKASLPEALTVLACVTIYVAGGYLFDAWYYLWLVFLAIPMLAIIRHAPKKTQLVALMPFIAVILFFALGFVFGLWYIAWIVFLLIPMVAILQR